MELISCKMPQIIKTFYVSFASYCECLKSPRLFLCVLCLKLWMSQITKTVSMCPLPHTVNVSNHQDCFYVCYASYFECLRWTRLFLCVLCLILWVPQMNKTVSVYAMPHTVSASDEQDCFCVCYASYCECLRWTRLFLFVLCLILWVPQMNKTVSMCAMPHTVNASDHQDCFCVCYASYCECLRSTRPFCVCYASYCASDEQDCFYVCYASYCECLRWTRLSVFAKPNTVNASDQKYCFCVCYAPYYQCLRSKRLFLWVLCFMLWVPQINKTVPVCAMPHTVSAIEQEPQITNTVSMCAMPHTVSASDQQDCF